MASGSASYSVSATNYGRNPTDSYFILSAPDVVNGNLSVTGNLSVAGSSALMGAVTCGETLGVAGAATVGSLTTAGAVSAATLASSGALTVGANAAVVGALSAASVATPGALSVAGATTLAGVTAQAVGCASVAATGAVSAASLAATGAVTGASLAVTGAAVSQNSYTTQANVVAAQNVNTAIGPVITKPCMVAITILERVAAGGANNRTEFGFLYYNGNPALTGGLTYYRYNANTGGNITLVWGQAPDVNRWTFGSSAGGGCDVIATVTITNQSP